VRRFTAGTAFKDAVDPKAAAGRAAKKERAAFPPPTLRAPGAPEKHSSGRCAAPTEKYTRGHAQATFNDDVVALGGARARLHHVTRFEENGSIVLSPHWAHVLPIRE
jgi:hypothetical protein